MTFEELKEFFDNTLNKEKWEVPIVRLFTQDEVEAMLTDLQLEIEELDLEDSVADYQKGAEETREHIANMIEEKINALKADSEGGRNEIHSNNKH